MDTNPHKLLPFGPKTKGGKDVLHLTKTSGLKTTDPLMIMGFTDEASSGLSTDSAWNLNGVRVILEADPGKPDEMEYKMYEHSDKFDLVHTDQPPYAPQPYKQWEDARKLERYEKVLESDSGANLILFERIRQYQEEGVTDEADDKLNEEDLLLAAIAYIKNSPLHYWPWDIKFYKPTTRKRDLVKAGALICAAIDKIAREALKGGGDE